MVSHIGASQLCVSMRLTTKSRCCNLDEEAIKVSIDFNKLAICKSSSLGDARFIVSGLMLQFLHGPLFGTNLNIL